MELVLGTGVASVIEFSALPNFSTGIPDPCLFSSSANRSLNPTERSHWSPDVWGRESGIAPVKSARSGPKTQVLASMRTWGDRFSLKRFDSFA